MALQPLLLHAIKSYQRTTTLSILDLLAMRSLLLDKRGQLAADLGTNRLHRVPRRQ